MSPNHDSRPAADHAATTGTVTATGSADPAAAGTRLLRQRLRGRFAALSVVGMLMVTLPLLQVLQYQNTEVQTLATERAGLDPVARAVDVQRSLLAHRDAAATVLRGDAALEPERLLRQREVDDRIGTLAVALANGAWERAVRESDALREDWSLLARQVAQRSVSAVESDQVHRLLVEQTLQVADLVADATLPRALASHGDVDASVGGRLASTDDAGFAPLARLIDLPPARAGDDTVATLAAAHALPRLAWQLTLLATPAPDRSAAAQQRDLADAEAAVARALGAMDRAVEHQQSSSARQLLAQAAANAGAAADGYFALLRGAHPAPQQRLQAGAHAAADAQLQLFQLARSAVDERLLLQLDAAELRRTLFVTTMAVLALVALALISSLARRLRHWQGQALQAPALDSGEPAPAAAHGHGSETMRLLQRLRAGDERARQARTRSHHQPQPTLPPET